MTPTTCWSLFIETGDPMFYLLYCEAQTGGPESEKTIKSAKTA